MSASIIVQYGPDNTRVRSSTVSPARAPPVCTFVFVALSLMACLVYSLVRRHGTPSGGLLAGEHRCETPETFHQRRGVAANPQPQMVLESEVRSGTISRPCSTRRTSARSDDGRDPS